MDREKVIKALELCAEGHHCHECSYQPVKHNLDGIADCTSLLAGHALELLKELQEERDKAYRHTASLVANTISDVDIDTFRKYLNHSAIKSIEEQEGR